jgi:hypothetical protein
MGGSWQSLLFKSNEEDKSKSQGQQRPFGATIKSVNPNERGKVSYYGNRDRDVSIPHPFISTGSWIRALPERGTEMLMLYRSDQGEPQLVNTFQRDTEKRVNAYRNGIGIYRALYPGEIEVNSVGLSQTFYSRRGYQSSKGGILHKEMNQDTLIIAQRSPTHQLQFLNYTSKDIKDEYRVGLLSRPENSWKVNYPKLQGNYTAEEYLNLTNPAKSNPETLFVRQAGHVLDLKGQPIKQTVTQKNLRYIEKYFNTSNNPTAYEVDDTGNILLKFAQESTEGYQIDIPAGNMVFKINKDFDSTVDGNYVQVVKQATTYTHSKNYKITVTGKLTHKSEDDATYTYTKCNINADSHVINAKEEINHFSQATAQLVGLSATRVGGGSPTQVLGTTVSLGGGAKPVARLGDKVIVYLGPIPLPGSVVEGSPLVTSA